MWLNRDVLLKKFPIIHSDTKKLTSKHAKNKIIFLYDHMPFIHDFRIHINHAPQYEKNSYIELFNKAGIDHTDKIFLSDHYLKFEGLDKIFPVNNILIREASSFLEKFNTFEISENKQINKNLLFLSNKSRPNRMLTCRMIANMFDENEVSFTYISNENNKLVTDELLLDTDYNISNKFLPTRFYISSRENQYEPNFNLINNIKSSNLFEYFFNNSIFNSTATSIITEPSYYESGVILTEKTLMAIYSGDFMLWPGGYKHAEIMKKIGFDIFDDIIDHSYQFYSHPGQRVVEAFLKNQTFLKDLKLQQHLRHKHMSRLKENLMIAKDVKKLTNLILKLQIGNVELSTEDIDYINYELQKF